VVFEVNNIVTEYKLLPSSNCIREDT